MYVNEKKSKNEVHFGPFMVFSLSTRVNPICVFELVVEDRLKRTQLLTLLALTACSRLKRTQPLNQHFFFFVVVFFVLLLRPPPGFSPRKSRYFSRRGATATWPRGLVRWQVPPERHMRIVFTCAVFIEIQFCCNLQSSRTSLEGGGRRRNSEETKRLSQHGLHTHTTRTFVSIRPPIRNFLPSLIFPSFLCTKIAAPRRKSVLELHSPNFRPFEVAFERQTTQTDGRHLKPSDRT